MKRLFVGLLLLVASLGYCLSDSNPEKESVAQLFGNHHACTGFRVRAPSGHAYVLTARHCNSLIDPATGNIRAIHEDGSYAQLHVIAQAESSDLMLLEDDLALYAVTIADTIRTGAKIHHYTHPHAGPLFRGDGEFIWYSRVFIPGATDFPFDFIEALVRVEGIMPGSSGGPVFNESGELMGVVSAANHETGDSFLVTLHDIQVFLADK